jgi:hypothetical protein
MRAKLQRGPISPKIRSGSQSHNNSTANGIPFSRKERDNKCEEASGRADLILIIIEQWKLYLVMACTTVTSVGAQSQSQLANAQQSMGAYCGNLVLSARDVMMLCIWTRRAHTISLPRVTDLSPRVQDSRNMLPWMHTRIAPLGKTWQLRSSSSFPKGAILVCIHGSILRESCTLGERCDDVVHLDETSNGSFTWSWPAPLSPVSGLNRKVSWQMRSMRAKLQRGGLMGPL